MDTRSIICFDGAGGGDLIHKNDSGLGNRIIYWASIYYISTLYDDCRIIVEKKYWPELEFLDLPNTESCDIDPNYIKEHCTLLSSSDIKDIILNKKTNIFDNNVFPYYHDTLEPLSGSFITLDNSIISLGISQIKFKNEKVDKFFEDNFSDFYSIHLRRGMGTNPTLGFIKDFLSYKDKKELKMYFEEYLRYCPPTDHYNIIPDSPYFSLIDEIISDKKTQRFYISSDIQETYYSYYFDKYPNNVKKLGKQFKQFLSFYDYDEGICELYSLNGLNTKQILINLFDLFVLSYSNTVIVDSCSTWGIIAFLMSKRKNKINVIQHTLTRDSISINMFIKKYLYYQVKSIREKNNRTIYQDTF